MQELLVTTVDIARPYTIIGQVSCYATSTLFSPYSLKKLFKKYKSELQPIYEQQRHLLPEATEEALFAEQICTHKGEMASVAYPLLLMELRQKARRMGADAVVGVRFSPQPESLSSYSHYCIYGTAVLFITE